MEKNSNFTVPAAIIVAGLLIAGAVYFSDSKPQTTEIKPETSSSTTVPSLEMRISPVTDKDYIRGNPNAKVVLIEYSDTECPFCKKYHTTLKSLIDKFGKDGTLAWVYRNFPIEQLHPKAPHEAEALLCAGKLGGQTAFWKYTDRIYEITPSNNGLEEKQLSEIAQYAGLNESAFNTCLSSGEMKARIQTEHDEGSNSGGTGTPHSIFVVDKPYNKTEVESYINNFIKNYNLPAELFSLSSDNKRVGVSGAMPQEFVEGLITLLSR